jgi:hypothetical protein
MLSALTQISVESEVNDVNEVKKKGRKPKTPYFDKQEEIAVRMFLTASTFNEKNQIYNQYLRKPLDKMISSIIRRYRLYRKDMDFEEIHGDTHSFLITKMEKFNPDRNKKAYSYFGTICKNYLMGQIIKDQKEINRKISYEDISSSLEENEKYSYVIDGDPITASDVINGFIENLKTELSESDRFNDNEMRLGIALIDILENYRTIFEDTDSNKFNKNLILLSIREMTNLNTKEIRNSMKRFKKLYLVMTDDIFK